MFYYEKPQIRDVFLYDRQSLDEKDVRQTHSLPLQEEFNREFADRMNLRIVDRFYDDASAKMPNNRPEFTKMLKELSYRNSSKRRAEGILSWHPDRLARNGLEAGRIVQMISDDLIKDMFFPTYRFHNDPSGIEHLMMEFGRAISYSGWLSINSKRGSVDRVTGKHTKTKQQNVLEAFRNAQRDQTQRDTLILKQQDQKERLTALQRKAKEKPKTVQDTLKTDMERLQTLRDNSRPSPQSRDGPER